MMRNCKYLFVAISIATLTIACTSTNSENQSINSIDTNLKIDSANSDTLLESIEEIEKSKESEYWEKYFVSAVNKDSVKMHLIKTSTGIKGELKFIPLMKDRRLGTLTDGVIKGDTLYAQYDSMQEGVRNIGEIAFLKDKDGYILTNDIFSEQNYRFNKDYSVGKFKNKAKITFNGVRLKEISKELY